MSLINQLKSQVVSSVKSHVNHSIEGLLDSSALSSFVDGHQDLINKLRAGEVLITDSMIEEQLIKELSDTDTLRCFAVYGYEGIGKITDCRK